TAPAGCGGNLLGRAVHSLSRIGDELYLEPTESGVRTVPPCCQLSRSAFASFLFAPLFFELYEPGIAGPDTELFRCKVHMKSFLSVFRSLPSLEKSVGKCLILLKPRASRLVLQLHCKYGECWWGHSLGGDTAQRGTHWHHILPC
uniref:Uncharacterized protein n=1 Tax=Malurus cyaneus samueli TaxID=2593467 RepID=A0A8C5X0S0_9PASS